MVKPNASENETKTKKIKRKTNKTKKVKKIKIKSDSNVMKQESVLPQVISELLSLDDIGDRFPILKDDQLVEKFLTVSMTNNQKGRIRQTVRENLKGTSESLLPEVINNKILSILQESSNLTDAELRKIRILYNMLKTASTNVKPKESKMAKKEKEIEEIKKKLQILPDLVPEKPVEKEKEKEKEKKLAKRYVVFLGNLPMDINKEKILKHFSDISHGIKDIRIPKQADDKSSCIAYVELKDAPYYEIALSKHHSMLHNKRINVQYTTHSNSKLTKTEAKSKSAKLVALQKSGKLVGSVPANKKRSFRRKKQKAAKAKELLDK